MKKFNRTQFDRVHSCQEHSATTSFIQVLNGLKPKTTKMKHTETKQRNEQSETKPTDEIERQLLLLLRDNREHSNLSVIFWLTGNITDSG